MTSLVIRSLALAPLTVAIIFASVASRAASAAEVGERPEATTPAQPTSILGTKLPTDWEAHPLAKALKMAYEGYRRISEEVDDYTCTLVKRERINGELRDFEYMEAKIRHEQRAGDQPDGEIIAPFAVHLRFIGPERVEGREVLFVEGENNGRMFARRGGSRFANMAARVDPAGELAMRDNRYPITQIGMLHLVRQLVERAEQDLHHDECQVQFFKGTKINGRSCIEIKVTHPVRREHFAYHVARILIDEELRVPIHYESYDWPTKEGEPPPLTESYSYLDLNLNPGLSALDFDYRNPEYGFEYLNREGSAPERSGLATDR